jgi:hypothetical protein
MCTTSRGCAGRNQKAAAYASRLRRAMVNSDQLAVKQMKIAETRGLEMRR